MRHEFKRLVGGMAALSIALGLSACAAPAAPSEQPSDAQSTPTEAQTQQQTPDQQEKPIGVYINLQDNSILTFDNDKASAQLTEDMRAAKMPTACSVLYDEEGSLPTVNVSDARIMRDLYKELAPIKVVGETSESVTDGYHHVSFELQDGTTASFDFEGDNILVRGGKSYTVEGSDRLWDYVRQLQEQHLREESAGDDWLPITYEDDEQMLEVQTLVKSAPAGEVVQITVPLMADAYPHVSVNGDEDFGAFTYPYLYEFEMPNEPVTVSVWSATDGLGGA